MKAIHFLAVVAVSGGLASIAQAAVDDVPTNPALTDRFFIGLGAYLPKSSTTARLNPSSGGVGASFDFERALGLEDQKGVPTVMGRIRLGERWRIEAEYFELNRRGTRTLDQQISWGDQTYPVGATVDSRLDFADTRVSAGYSFFKRQDKEVGIALGFHVARYDANLSGSVQNATRAQGAAITAPLPLLSVFGTFALTDQWSIGARLDRFSLSYDQYDGSITSMAMDLLYQPFRHLGFGLGYRSLFVELEATKPSWNGRIEQSYQGPTVYVTGSF